MKTKKLAGKKSKKAYYYMRVYVSPPHISLLRVQSERKELRLSVLDLFSISANVTRKSSFRNPYLWAPTGLSFQYHVPQAIIFVVDFSNTWNTNIPRSLLFKNSGIQKEKSVGDIHILFLHVHGFKI